MAKPRSIPLAFPENSSPSAEANDLTMDKSHAKHETSEKHLASRAILKCKSGRLQIFFHLSHWPFRNGTLDVEGGAVDGLQASTTASLRGRPAAGGAESGGLCALGP